MRIENTENVIIRIRGNELFLGIGIIAFTMAAGGVVLLFNLSFEPEYMAADVFGLVFVLIWIFVILGLGVFSLLQFTKELVLDDKGVSCNAFIGKHHLEWSEVKDWGFSYCGQTRGEGNTYYLYFSGKSLETKNNERKRIKGVKIKIVLMESDYNEVSGAVTRFCKERIDEAPFVPRMIFHII